MEIEISHSTFFCEPSPHAPESAIVPPNVPCYLFWERRRLGGSLSKNRKKAISHILIGNCDCQQPAGGTPAFPGCPIIQKVCGINRPAGNTIKESMMKTPPGIVQKKRFIVITDMFPARAGVALH
jgi:hypothetical protein